MFKFDLTFESQFVIIKYYGVTVDDRIIEYVYE